MQTIGMDRDEAIRTKRLIDISKITLGYRKLESGSTTISSRLLEKMLPDFKAPATRISPVSLTMDDVALLLQMLEHINEQLHYNSNTTGRDEWLVEIGYANTMMIVRKDLRQLKEGETTEGYWNEMITIALQGEESE